VALVRTNVSEERIAYIIRVTGIIQLLVTANVIPSSPILVTLMMEAASSSQTSALTIATRRNIPRDGILREAEYQGLAHQYLYIAFSTYYTPFIIKSSIANTNSVAFSPQANYTD
jgi:hypothetical protein